MRVEPPVLQALHPSHCVRQAAVDHEVVVGVVAARGELRGENDAVNELQPPGGREHVRWQIPIPCHDPRARGAAQRHRGLEQDLQVGRRQALRVPQVD